MPKFDVIVGNLPYQDPIKQHKIYPRFILHINVFEKTSNRGRVDR